MKSRTYHDPLHGAITLNGSDQVESLLIKLIDTPEFQRLRRIRQLDTANLTFHSGEGSRFTHSLGVMALTRRAFDHLVDQYPSLKPHRCIVLVAALLHDLGHGAFSHAGEEIFGSQHEFWTIKLIQESSIYDILYTFDPELPANLELVFTKKYPVTVISQLVSSQLDCDRLDYLQRDGYFTGAQYGHLDLDRILLALNYDPDSQSLVITKKGLVAIEHYLTVRYFMYVQVYNHPKNLAARFGLGKIFERARVVLATKSLPADKTVTAWLTQDLQTLDIKDYLAADDIVFMYHIHLWKNHEDQILADLCRRIQDRDLFKGSEITNLEDIEEYIQQWQQKLETIGFDPQYYCGIREALTKGYTLYQQGIAVKTNEGLQEISQISSLVKTLVQPMRKKWLIHPKLAN
ncbi:HD superfamily phosphohydrolase [Synechococcus sp. PCC 7502]|uniref:HD domain-containing protein n=1 Tax=Synechococcus sp. PCC 7502 TaxID=1173263 RepID=UPI00029FAFBB|nr:HD domain-containing protein [Synechococcus sp. PCC 7502]AFY74269.1 HD superfamily phosphohydrolase [Synechococcus sp. PCC 7502]